MLQKTLLIILRNLWKGVLLEEVAKAKFFSIFLDGSTDNGNVDNEFMIICWRDKMKNCIQE